MLLEYNIRGINRDGSVAWLTVMGTRVLEAVDIEFEHTDEGGCGSCSFTLVSSDKAVISALVIEPDQEILIKARTTGSVSFINVYYGSVSSFSDARSTDGQYQIRIEAIGIFAQFADVNVYRFYDYLFLGKGTPLVGVVEKLMEEVIADSGVNVQTSLANVDHCYTLVEQVDIPNEPLDDVLRKLSDLQGSVVFGVDPDRLLFFKERTQVAQNQFRLGDEIEMLKLDHSNVHRLNHLIFQTKDLLAGGDLSVEVEDPGLAVPLNYLRRRTGFIRLSEIGDSLSIGSISAAMLEDMNRDTTPIVLKIAKELKIFDMWAPVTILENDGTPIGTFDIRSVSYAIESTDVFSMKLELGAYRSDISDEHRRTLRTQRIAQSKYNSSNPKLVAGAYRWLNDTKRAIAQAYQTQNFWGNEVQDTKNLVLPDEDGTSGDQIPVVEDKGGISGLPIPLSVADGGNPPYTEAVSVEIPTLVPRDSVVVSLDHEYRTIGWRNGEYGKYCVKSDYGDGGTYGGAQSSWDKGSGGFIRPKEWIYRYTPDGIPESDSFVWFEAQMDPFTDFTAYILGIEDLASTESFELTWDVSPTQETTVGRINNRTFLKFDLESGNIICRLIERVGGSYDALTNGWANCGIPGSSPWWKVHVERSYTPGTLLRVRVYQWVASAWSLKATLGPTEQTRYTYSFWGARWQHKDTFSSDPLPVKLGRVIFSGDYPLIEASRDRGNSWRECAEDIQMNISSQGVGNSTMQIKVNLTFYNILKGWGFAFK